MKIKTSSLSEEMKELYCDFENEFGFGPCGAYSTLMRERGRGQIAWTYVRASEDDYEWAHYFIVDANDEIVDETNPFESALLFDEENLELLEDDEFPELIYGYDDSAVQWLRERM